MADADIKQSKIQDADIQDAEHQLYEIAYILSGTLNEEKAYGDAGDMRSFIEQKHDMVVESTPPKLKKLAYLIKGHSEGFFGWIKFLGTPADIADIEKQMKKNPDILRFLITQSYREEFTERRTKIRKKVMTEEEKGRIEEIDKKLEEILGE